MSESVQLFECQRVCCDGKLNLFQEICDKCNRENRWERYLKMQCPNCDGLTNVLKHQCACGVPLNGWDAVVHYVVENTEAHTDVGVSKAALPNPEQDSLNFYSSTGLDGSTEGDYRLRIEDGRGVHIKEYDDRYAVHWDRVDPRENAIGHIAQDAPGLAVLGLGAIALVASLE